MTDAKQPPRKKEILLAALGEGMVMLHLDGRNAEVMIPDYLRKDAHVRLDLSYEFRLPDLVIDDWGVKATLSFRRTPFSCAVPWTALFAMTFYATEQGVVFTEDLPPELREPFQRAEEAARAAGRLQPSEAELDATPWKPAKKDAKRRRGLTSVPEETPAAASSGADGPTEVPDSAAAETPPPPPDRPRPALRLVK
jgi:stringent starvation protein B